MTLLGWLVVVGTLVALAVVIGWLAAFVWNAVEQLRRRRGQRTGAGRPRSSD